MLSFSNKETEMVEDRVKVGEGAYATVYKQTFAVKRFVDDPDGHALAELKMLQRCCHPRILSCMGTYNDEQGCMNLVLPFHPQTLAQKMYGLPLPHQEIKSYLRHLLEGVAYLHNQQHIIHTDLKPQNLLISSKNQLVICDFSCALLVDSGDVTDNNCGTLWYRSPEVLLGGETPKIPVVTYAMDMWAVGCIIWEMLHGKPWFRGDCEIDQMFQIFRVCGTPTEEVWPGVSQRPYFKKTFPQWNSVLSRSLSSINNPQLELLMHKIMVMDPKQRITAQEALQHPYFDINTFSQKGQDTSDEDSVEDSDD
jgi:serine/threonine protein kinase